MSSQTNEITALSEKLGELLLEKGLSVTTAESCTGGGIAAAITETAGSSSYFNCAWVTYSNEMKSRLVGVETNTLDQHGAVSRDVVVQMAYGALKNAKADMAIAVSGIAGPGGGTPDKPVGTVWAAIVYAVDTEESTVWTQQYLFCGNRKSIRDQTTEATLRKASEILEEKK